MDDAGYHGRCHSHRIVKIQKSHLIRGKSADKHLHIIKNYIAYSVLLFLNCKTGTNYGTFNFNFYPEVMYECNKFLSLQQTVNVQCVP